MAAAPETTVGRLADEAPRPRGLPLCGAMLLPFLCYPIGLALPSQAKWLDQSVLALGLLAVLALGVVCCATMPIRRGWRLVLVPAYAVLAGFAVFSLTLRLLCSWYGDCL